MTTEKLTLIQAAIQKMHWHEERQKVLAANIANADTPGYKAQEIAPLDFKELLGRTSSPLSLSVATTDPKHFGLGGAPSGQSAVKTSKSGHGASLTGNSVDLEEQLLKMNENYTDHRLTTTIYQKNIEMLKTSLKN